MADWLVDLMMRPKSAGSRWTSHQKEVVSLKSGSPIKHETLENRARRRQNRRLRQIISEKPESLTTPHHRGVRSPFADDVHGQRSTNGSKRGIRKPRFTELTLVRGEPGNRGRQAAEEFILKRLHKGR